MNFRDIIKSELERQNKSVFQLAKEINFHRGHLYNYLKGIQDIGSDKVEKIFNNLKIKLSCSQENN